ncbi:MAG: site-2 protease family protein [Oscillospiraceae bacterium]|nr:site-2 protease family protein [Oscillospiraceae bacterium]
MSGLTSWFQGIDLSRLIERIFYAGAALIAISVHESCHGLSAYWLGDDTAKRQGRISLNPLRHLDLFGFVMMVAFRFGWAKPVPVNPYRMTKIKSPKLGMALTAAAGPVSNLLLALSFGTAFYILLYSGDQKLLYMWAGYREASGWGYYLSRFFRICMSLNAGLAVFNLIPISPLDGSKILAIVLPERAYAQLMRYERYGFFLLAALLFSGVLDRPLALLQQGVLNCVSAVAEPIAKAAAGIL